MHYAVGLCGHIAFHHHVFNFSLEIADMVNSTMLNTAIATTKGDKFVNGTDATGNRFCDLSIVI